MNLPKDFPELEVLLRQMQTTSQPFKPVVDIQLQTDGIPVSPDEFDVIDNIIPIIQNRKAVFYIWDAETYRRNAEIYRWRNKEPRYHVVNCEKLQEMKEKKRFDQYRAARPTDGNFPVKPSSNNEPIHLKLILCRFCLNELSEQYGDGVFPKDPIEFPLADWFETFEEDLNKTGSSHAPFDYSSEAWRKRSLACREKVNWICQECNTNLKTDRHLLHAHHQWGTQYNNLQDLIALCIHCHAEQPGGGHQLLKYYPEYEELTKKYGKKSPSNREFNRFDQRPLLGQEASVLTYYDTETTEEDIPF